MHVFSICADINKHYGRWPLQSAKGWLGSQKGKILRLGTDIHNRRTSRANIRAWDILPWGMMCTLAFEMRNICSWKCISLLRDEALHFQWRKSTFIDSSCIFETQSIRKSSWKSDIDFLTVEHAWGHTSPPKGCALYTFSCTRMTCISRECGITTPSFWKEKRRKRRAGEPLNGRKWAVLKADEWPTIRLLKQEWSGYDEKCLSGCEKKVEDQSCILAQTEGSTEQSRLPS